MPIWRVVGVVRLHDDVRLGRGALEDAPFARQPDEPGLLRAGAKRGRPMPRRGLPPRLHLGRLGAVVRVLGGVRRGDEETPSERSALGVVGRSGLRPWRRDRVFAMRRAALPRGLRVERLGLRMERVLPVLRRRAYGQGAVRPCARAVVRQAVCRQRTGRAGLQCHGLRAGLHLGALGRMVPVRQDVRWRRPAALPGDRCPEQRRWPGVRG
mmetsp:Transcript_3118/g.9072  ORF Transcript_3118/g.9072 Transcript_3118/m.9072 type:complete len:211 (+) Transcript_3118:342-974(+)